MAFLNIAEEAYYFASTNTVGIHLHQISARNARTLSDYFIAKGKRIILTLTETKPFLPFVLILIPCIKIIQCNGIANIRVAVRCSKLGLGKETRKTTLR
jgi:hypothetical protein